MTTNTQTNEELLDAKRFCFLERNNVSIKYQNIENEGFILCIVSCFDREVRRKTLREAIDILASYEQTSALEVAR